MCKVCFYCCHTESPLQDCKKKSMYVNSVVGDARDTEFLKIIITEGKFDSIINCIGILNEFANMNKGLAVFLNSYLPHFLTE